MESEKILKMGLVGKLNGCRIHGKSYNEKGEEIEEEHEADCFCCRESLLGKHPTN
jgi:hypothetical protein